MATVENEYTAQLKRLEFIALNAGIPLHNLAKLADVTSDIEALRHETATLDYAAAMRIYDISPSFSLSWLLTGKIQLGRYDPEK